MIQVKVVFKLDEEFTENYEHFINTMLKVNKAEDLYKRKADNTLWTEKQLDKYYQIKAFFSTKEIKILDEDFHKHLIVYGDDRFGEFRNLPNKLNRKIR